MPVNKLTKINILVEEINIKSHNFIDFVAFIVELHHHSLNDRHRGRLKELSVNGPRLFRLALEGELDMAAQMSPTSTNRVSFLWLRLQNV